MSKKFGISSILYPIWIGGVYLFLYLPLIVLAVFSCNDGAFPYRWIGFSARWYIELFHSSEILIAAKNSLFVAVLAVILSLLLALSFVLWSAQKRSIDLLAFFYPNLVVPEIVLSVGLLSFFVFFHVPMGLLTLVVGHTLLGLGYAIPLVKAQFDELDGRMIEASFDLGANHKQTFFKVVLPSLRPSLIAAGLLVFMISMEDFLIAFFCAGTSAQTLPLYIFAMLRSGVSPVVNALATVMLIVSSLLVIAFTSVQIKERVW